MKMIKKIVIVAVVSMLTITLSGCGKENVKLDLSKVKSDLINLKEDDFAPLYVTNAIEETKPAIFGELKDVDIYSAEFKKDYGIESTDIEQAFIRVSTDATKVESYYLIKAVEGKEEAIKKAMKKYFENKVAKTTDAVNKKLVEDHLEMTYEGYLVYVVSSKQDEVIKRIKSARQPVFSMMGDVNDEVLENTFKIKKDQVEEYLIQTPMTITSASTYIIVKPKKEEKTAVKKAIDEYIAALEKQWSTYLPSQYELVQKRMVTEVGDYLVYIISNNNDKVLETIKDNK